MTKISYSAIFSFPGSSSKAITLYIFGLFPSLMKLQGLIKMLVFFLPFFTCLSLQAQTLTLYAIPPSHSINWKIPNHLAFSMVRNFLTKKKSADPIRPLGHIIVELKKDGDTVLTGIVSNKSKDFFSPFFLKNAGWVCCSNYSKVTLK